MVGRITAMQSTRTQIQAREQLVKRFATGSILLIAAMFFAYSAHAETITDPTRPAGADVSPTGTPGAAGQNTAGLQSIVHRKGSKPYAVINGETVRLGGKVGEARVIKITDSTVILKSANGQETLSLTPGIDKQIKKSAKAK